MSFWAKQAGIINPKLSQFIKLFIGSLKRGKYLRGVLVKLGYELTKAPKNGSILQAAAAYETLHSSLLAHDDIIDRSILRRGRKSLYQSLGGNHYGISQAICLGDFGIFLAIELLNSSNFHTSRKNKAIDLFNLTCINTAFGQMLDIELPRQKNPREKDVIGIYNLKTAKYSIIGPLLVGAILGGASESFLKNLELFGKNLGIAYQIKDDILGVFGDEKTLGKSVTSDIEEGKNTLLLTYALQNANQKQRDFIKKNYGKGKISPKNFLETRQIFTRCGALEYAENKALAYTTNAKKIIPAITKNRLNQLLLNGLSDFLINRSR